MRLPLNSLRSRLTLSIALSALVGVVAAISVWVEKFQDDQNQIATEVDTRARGVVDALRDTSRTLNPDLGQALLATLAADETVLEAHLFDAGAECVASFSLEDEAGAGAEPVRASEIPLGAPGWMVFPIRRAAVPAGSLAVRYAVPDLGDALAESTHLLLLLLGTGLSIVLLNRWVQASVLSPIVGLSEAARVVSSEQDYSIRALHSGGDEIGQLVETFNGMLTQIELRDLELQYEMERAEAGTRAKSQFLATMSHELRTPMNGVIGMSDLLIDTELTVDQRIFAETIQSSAMGLLSIINDILDFSKIESGHLELEETEVDLRRVIDDSVGTLAHAARDRGLVLLRRIGEDVPAQLRGDPSRLRQVLLNLLANALKFTREGEVELRVELDSQDDSASIVLRFEIEDTGIGIPAERMDRLFKSFSQVDVSDTRKYGGTGLGLAISREIVLAMGGELSVRSTEGVGSTFSFTARFGVAEAEDLDAQDGGAPLRVLIAHSHPRRRANLQHQIGCRHVVEACGDVAGIRDALRRSEDPVGLAFIELELLVDDGASCTLSVEELQREGLTVVLLADVHQASLAASRIEGSVRGFLSLPARHDELDAWLRSARTGAAVPRGGGRPHPIGPEPPIHSLEPPANELRGRSRADRPAPRSEPSLPPGMRVLVAEDNAVNQRVVTRFLEKMGAEVVIAQDGREAVRRWRERDPDLVLMDLQMPEMDGLEATREIRRLEEGAGPCTPIVALTANVGRDVRERCLQAGMDGHLSKPFQLRELREVLVRCLEDVAPPGASERRLAG